MPSVLVIGEVMTDVIVKPKGPLAIGADRRAAVRILPGGSGANQAAWLAAEGIRATFAGRVGRTDHARQLALFVECGVTALLGADDRLPTGTIVTLLAADGERSFLSDSGANLNLCRADLPDVLLEGVDLVCISGYALFSQPSRDAVLSLLTEVRRRSIPFAIDPSSYSFLEDVGPREFLGWTTGARMSFPNGEEAAVLAGSTDIKEQLRMLSDVYELVVIKRGTEGAYAAQARTGRRWSVPVPTVEAVDSTGGGDAFLAGFVSTWMRGGEIEACLQRGVALGARAVVQWGGRPGAEATSLGE
jgi:sugar/nucleoside kinase (ribokinase family)